MYQKTNPITSIKIGLSSAAEYIVEQGDDMYVTARKVEEDGGKPAGEAQVLGQMDDISDLEVQRQISAILYGEANYSTGLTE